MAIELPDGTVSRTMPEQVGENTRRLDVLEGYQLESFYREGDNLYAKRVSGEVIDLGEVSGVASVALTSGSLIFTLTDGTTINAGLVKGITSMSIDGSQHLIVAYNNGTTEDLGAIFSGNVNIAGNLTADSIIENMSGYSFTIRDDQAAYGELTAIYAGAVKNGNKLTLVLFANWRVISKHGSLSLCYFTIPLGVAAKLYPYTYGSYDNVLDNRKVNTVQISDATYVEANTFIRKYTDKLYILINDTNMVVGQTYNFRVEATFLLSDSLAS